MSRGAADTISSMDAAMLWLTGVLAAAAIASAIIAFVQARAALHSKDDAETARSEAREARDETSRLAAEANAAFTRQAEAQELANEIELAKLPKPHVSWDIHPGHGDIRRLVNSGNIAALNVRLQGTEGVHTDEDSQSERVPPRDHVEFATWRGSGMGRPQLRIKWDDEGTGESREETRSV